MKPETLRTIFEIGGVIAEHIWRVIDGGDKAEMKRLLDVWPAPIKSRLELLAIEEQARKRVVEGK